jgi:uncharacterized membrane protein YfcA
MGRGNKHRARVAVTSASALDLIAGSVDVATALSVAAAALIGSLASSLTGSGGAAIIAFVLAPIIGVAAVVQTISVAMVISHISRIGVFWAHIHWPMCALMLAGAAPGCVLGSLIYTQLDERAIAAVLGFFLVGMVLARRLMPRNLGPLPRGVVLAVAATYGLIAGTTIGGGILVLPILVGAGLGGMALIGTDAAIGLATHFIKIVVFGSTQVLTLELAVVGIVVGTCMIPGTFIARWLQQRIPLAIHAVLVDAVILLGGLGFLIRALTGSA